eukprot:CFRG4782T1
MTKKSLAVEEDAANLSSHLKSEGHETMTTPHVKHSGVFSNKVLSDINKEFDNVENDKTLSPDQKLAYMKDLYNKLMLDDKDPGDTKLSEAVANKEAYFDSLPKQANDTIQLQSDSSGKFSWVQTLDTLTVHVPVTSTVKSKAVKCDISTTALKLIVNGDTIVEGPFSEKVDNEGSFWEIEGKDQSRTIIITITKDMEGTWKSLLKQ